MPVVGGYAGKILKVDLGSETAREYVWHGEEQRGTLGGTALAAQLMLHQLTGGERAFSEENCVVIATGPLVGSGAPGSLRFDIASLSPKDDLPAFSNCGGSFGLFLKKAGYDAVVLTGCCQEPSWLEICEDGVRFHSAEELRGSGTNVCQDKLEQLLQRQQFGRLCIGPAGENLVKFASVIGEGHSAGRAGMGAVLGFKKLKAIAVHGSKTIPQYDREKVVDWNRQWYTCLTRHGEKNAGGEGHHCDRCPMHCAKHLHSPWEPLLNDLGMDLVDAEAAALSTEAQEMSPQERYEAIAYRRGIGNQLADGISRQKKGGGKRKGGNCGAVIQAFGLMPDAPETEVFCKDFAEAVSSAGQCMFTTNAMEEGAGALYLQAVLQYVTGAEWRAEDLVKIGGASRAAQLQLREKFQKK